MTQWQADSSSSIRCFGRSKALQPSYFHNGTNYIDFSKETIQFNDNGFKKWMDYYKLVYSHIPEGKTQEEQFWTSGFPIGNEYIFDDLSMFPCGEFLIDALKHQKGSILLPLLNEDGSLPAKASTMFAVNANSENKQNAWNFIKLMLDPEILSDKSFFLADILVSKQATMSRLSDCPQDIKEQYLTYLDNLKAESIPDPSTEIIIEEMTPYWKARKILKHV